MALTREDKEAPQKSRQGDSKTRKRKRRQEYDKIKDIEITRQK